MRERIDELEEMIVTHTKNREQLLVKLKQQKAGERLNRHGVDEDASISVRVVEARDLTPMDFSGKADPYCVLNFGERGQPKQQQKTNFVKQELNPVWNEVFSFDVVTGKEVLEVLVYDKDITSDDFEGRFEVTLSQFLDQT